MKNQYDKMTTPEVVMITGSLGVLVSSLMTLGILVS